VEVFDGGAGSGIKLVQSPCVPAMDQAFVPESVGQYLRLKAQHSGRCLSVSAQSLDNGRRLLTADCDTGDAQLWRIERTGLGQAFRLVAKHSQKCADVSGISLKDNAALHQWSCGPGARNQAFEFVAKVPELPAKQVPRRCALLYPQPNLAGAPRRVCSEQAAGTLTGSVRSALVGADYNLVLYGGRDFKGKSVALGPTQQSLDLTSALAGDALSLRAWPARAQRNCMRGFAGEGLTGALVRSECLNPASGFRGERRTNEGWQKQVGSLWLGEHVGLDTWQGTTWKAFEAGFTPSLGERRGRIEASLFRSWVKRELDKASWLTDAQTAVGVASHQGYVNLCVAWRVTQAFTEAERKTVSDLATRVYRDWQRELTGYHGYPQEEIPVRIVGYAVPQAKQAQFVSETPVHVGESCPRACSRPAHQNDLGYSFPGCTTQHFDFEFQVVPGDCCGYASGYGTSILFGQRSNYVIALHEAGHVHGFQDTYEVESWQKPASIMSITAPRITAFDRSVLRAIWDRRVRWDE
jgi:hypothetical protein